MKISRAGGLCAWACLIQLTLLLMLHSVHADSATWNLNPTNNDWNTATNWTPNTVPNATTDTATFGASNTTSVMTSANVDLASLVFTAGAPSYTIATDRARAMNFWGEGVHNDSGAQQTFTGNFSLGLCLGRRFQWANNLDCRRAPR